MGSIPITRSNQPTTTMKRLYQARDTIEANLLKDELLQSHIQATVIGEYATGAVGELSALNFPEVWVEEEDLHPARQVLSRFLKPKENAVPWKCPACGESVDGAFDLCWKCGTHRPLS